MMTNIDDIYNKFLYVVRTFLEMCVPSKSVTMGYKDPSFVTHLIKSLLNKRNRLRHRGKLEAANRLADRINGLISEYRSKQFVGLANANSKDLWAAIKGKQNKANDAIKFKNILSPYLINQFFCCCCN